VLPTYRFGDFELDFSRFELSRGGRVVKIQRVPLELLILLVERRGQVVSRQEIVERLWGNDVFVDTEHGINTAIRKIRAALRDDAERPRFLQTVSGKGYRFVPETEWTGNDTKENVSQPVDIATGAAAPPLSEASFATAGRYSRLSWVVGACAVLLVMSAIGLFASGRWRERIFPKSTGPIHSLAVLPLANLSGDASQDYFADGMTEELITALAKNPSLRVVSRTSAMQYKGAKRPLPEIARELGVDGILEGSITRAGNRVHMTVQLIYAPTDTHIWAETYDRDLDQAFAIPEQLSETVAREVRTATSAAPPAHYVNPEAYDAYLHGHYFWIAGNDKRSQEYFEKAIQIQPDYAAAWAGVSDSYAIRAIDNECPAKDVMTQTEAAAHKAVELDDSLAAAHHSLAAWYLFYAWDLPRADAESRRSIELDPTVAEQHHLHSYILFAMNRNEEALREQKRATELDPFARSWALGHAYLQLRRFDDAIAELRLRADAMPNEQWIRFYLSNAYWQKGMWKESQEELEKGLELSGATGSAKAAHEAFERGGERAVEQWGVKGTLARAQTSYVSPFEIAENYAYLGDKANTLKFLEQAHREHYPWLILLQTEPVFDFVHSEPRYQALIHKVGLQ
jgi:TolB-like protein/DNA-binding winged helix-turn-helix (wHTH) protein